MRKQKGQTIILTSLVIVLLILSLALTLNNASIIYQGIRYEGPKEIVDCISADANRLFVNLLAKSTQNYMVNKTDPLINQILSDTVLDYFTVWEQAILQAYSSKDVIINLTANRKPIALNWDTNSSSSFIGGKLSVDIPRLSLFGWNKTYTIYTNMKLNLMNQSRLNATIMKENNIPMDGLRPSSFIVKDQTGTNQTIKEVYNIGGGTYIIDLKSEIKGTFVRVYVQDNRGIWVSAKIGSLPKYSITIRNALSIQANWRLSNGIPTLPLEPGQNETITNVEAGTSALVIDPIYGFFNESGSRSYTITGNTTLTIVTFQLSIKNQLAERARWSLSAPDSRSDFINAGDTVIISIASSTQVSVTDPTYAFFNKVGNRTVTVRTNNTILNIVTFKLTIINRLGNMGTYTVDGTPYPINSLETQTISIANGSQVAITTPTGAFFNEKLASTATITANDTTLSYAHIEVSISNSLNRQAAYLFSDSLIGSGPINVGETKTFSYVRPGWVNVTSPNYGFFGLPVDSRKAVIGYSNTTFTIVTLSVSISLPGTSKINSAVVILSNGTYTWQYIFNKPQTITLQNIGTGWTLKITSSSPANAIFKETGSDFAIITSTRTNFTIDKKP